MAVFTKTRIFGAYGPIMFALRVWVGFGASWRGEIYYIGYQIGSWKGGLKKDIQTDRQTLRGF